MLMVDRQAYGSDTMSTHALMRGGVLQLTRWGLIPEIAAAGTPAIRSTTFHYGSEAIRVAIKPEHGVECLFAPRRTVLDRLLVDAARKAGADVRHGVLLSELLLCVGRPGHRRLAEGRGRVKHDRPRRTSSSELTAVSPRRPARQGQNLR